MHLTDCIRFMATPEDRDLLNAIARQEGDAGLSATLRKLIRTEAQRRGIRLPEPRPLPPAQPTPLSN
jgi:hypothetical protein